MDYRFYIMLVIFLSNFSEPSTYMRDINDLQ